MFKEYEAKNWPCKKCNEKQVWYRTKETYDGSQDRYYYNCRACGFRWSVTTEYE